jgi:hypothetical protein
LDKVTLTFATHDKAGITERMFFLPGKLLVEAMARWLFGHQTIGVLPK